MKWSNYKLSNFEKLLQKNFHSTNNKMKRKLLSKRTDDMIKECAYYQSTRFDCNCGESNIYKTKTKCTHMLCIQKGETVEDIELPKFPQMKIKAKTR